MNALILVDIQYDFIPGGAFAVADGDQVLAVANRLIPHFELVVATQDWHPANHQSFASQHEEKEIGDIINLEGLEQVLWPDHCIQGTQGANLHHGLNLSGIHRVIQKGTDPKIDSYSGFFDNGGRQSTGLSDFLHQQKVNEVTVIGLATDYCVKFTALDARKVGLKTNVVKEGCRGIEVNPGDEQRAYAEMQNEGVTLLAIDQIINESIQKKKPTGSMK